MWLPIRLGLFYAAIYVGTGVSSPYMPVWFAERGMSGAQIGMILSLPMLARTFLTPLLALWADSFKLRRTALIFMSLIVMASYAAMILPLGFAGWTVMWFVASSTFATISPLTDVIVLKHAARSGFNYGFPRGIGSAAFIVANVTMGAMLAWGSPEMVLVWIMAAAAVSAVGARLLLPPDPVHDGGEPAKLSDRWSGLGELIRDPVFMTAVVSAGLVQSAHAFYYGFSTLAWKQQGISEGLTGILWGFGVAVEIAFLFFLAPLARRLGPRWFLAGGSAAAVFRWTAMAFTPPIWLLFPLQALHALTYAATFVGALQLVERLSTPRNASAAQAVNYALAGGVLMGVATFASGPLFDRFGAGGYLLMSAMSLAGLIGALRLFGMRRLDPV
jgi:PPP family 3-phenylpropionic acid transporter